MPATLDELLTLLDLEVLDDRLFRGGQPEVSRLPRVYGGQVAAQALVAAQQTVPEGRFVHSLHSYFILGGDPSVPIVYDVEDVRDGGSFTTRRVAARQHGSIIFYMTASFQKEEEGFAHQDEMPEVLPPEQCQKMSDIIREFSPEWADGWDAEWSAAEARMVPIDEPSTQRVWLRLAGDIEDRRPLRAALLTYFSDLTLLGPTLHPHHRIVSSPDVQVASLDHSIWFHRTTNADQWFLYDQHSPSATGGRGLSLARVFSQQGELVASIAQEGLIRPIIPSPR
ncbi:MAG TPA: acyl-CoA thioesterase II [Aeromicrobium sp.]|nr:acyl-CoA thioesterase II [Aeromicrobium sp.]